MAYPFDSSVTQFCDLVKPLAELAKTDDSFDVDFPNRLPSGKAYDFDKIKERVCTYRSLNAKQQLRSADAFVLEFDESAEWYFIEFKNQKPDNIQSVKDPDRNELMQKAFDSLSVVAMTFGHQWTMQQIQERSVFVVVYPRMEYSDRFLAALNELSTGTGGRKPLWHLDKLTDAGFYKRILTINDEEFCALSLPYM